VKVTALDIRRKEFKRSVRGYADEEVDLFLDEVADEFERLHQANQEVEERVRRLEEQLVTHQQLRDALEKTLISAQFQADEVRANARKESELILRDAELKARGIVSDSYSEVQRVQQALVQLKHLEEDFRFKFKSLLEGHLKLLDEAPINMAANQPVVVDAGQVVEAAPVAAAPSVEPVPEPATKPSETPAATRTVSPTAETPFIIPTTVEEVPEYPQVAAAPVRPAPIAASEPAVAPESAVSAPPSSTEEPTTPAEQAAPAGERVPAVLLWPDETAVSGDDDAPTIDLGAFSAGLAGEPEQSMAGAGQPAPVGDESVTIARDDDPLQGFFFAPGQGAADTFFGTDKGGKSKTRDFEW